MASYNYTSLYLDEFGGFIYTDVTATFDTSCNVTTKTVKDNNDVTITPHTNLDTLIDADLAGQCGVNVNTADDYERFTNHNSKTVAVTNFVLADPATTSEDVYHKNYSVFLEAAGKYLAYGTDGHQHQYTIDVSGGNNNIVLNINPRGQNIVVKVKQT